MIEERMIRIISCAKCPEFSTDMSVGGYCRILKREPDVFYMGFDECGSVTILLNENKIDPDCPLEFAPIKATITNDNKTYECSYDVILDCGEDE
jgi:hypothetical protein